MIENYALRINPFIEKQLDHLSDVPQILQSAMRYVCTSGGKRVRAALVYATADSLGFDDPMLDYAAAAVECIHAYSLVHDDLPAMDNADLRRGKPSCHIAFDEATAILVGDALQAYAFQLLATPSPETRCPAHQRLEMIYQLSYASGPAGMVGGQVLDIAAEGKKIGLDELQHLHNLKTGALICASVKLGYLASPNLTDTQRERLDSFAKQIGLAFQVYDDILDVISDTQTLGKPQGLDAQLQKSTYPGLLGLKAAQQMAGELFQKSLDDLEALNLQMSPLAELARFIVERKN